jgi:hypothetical protein
MAEAKNSFLASKMNKDLDDRLIPSNEYKDALNIAVSNSEDSDVGALENILQNTNVLPISLATNLEADDGKIIGYVLDSSTDSVYLFWTNYTDDSSNKLDKHQAASSGTGSAILRYNAADDVGTLAEVLVSGTFLNFSTTHLIHGANVVEDLLFWTDNRNQPRKINIRTALANVSSSVKTVSLNAIGNSYSNGVYNTVNPVPGGIGTGLTVSITTQNGSIQGATIINPGSGYVVGDIVNVLGPGSGAGGKLNITSLENYYSKEDHISVAKYAPYKSIDLYRDESGQYKPTMKDVVSEYLPDGTTANPDYNDIYTGDKNFLEDKFVRFSYRFKFDDGEYSIQAPFTQIAFIPKQDGSFLAGDEDKTYQSTVVSFMENKVNQIFLVINLPDNGNDLENNYKIKELDILYKESDGIAISVLDTISIDEIKNKAASSSVYEYNYQARKPIKTLPQEQTTRVYDKTPVRALAQEVSGNRVIYGNYVNKHTAPEHLDYEVTVTQKFSDGPNDSNWSYIEYPEHTVKRNRNYQVGFVLSDRYGRQSDVILSKVTSDFSSGSNFGSSSLYFPYRSSATDSVTVLEDIGNSIKIQLNEKIQSTKSNLTDAALTSTGEPGLYNETTNPLGWYSYKVVVKQNQQEYYNVYTPGFLNGFLSNTTEQGETSHVSLYSDNINKVPRSLIEVGPDQKLYRSDETLFPIVENVLLSGNLNNNEQFYPGEKKYEIPTIGAYDELNNLGASGTDDAIYNSADNPLIARISTPSTLGVTHTHMLPFLSVAETSPFVSNIDIYYETSTAGLISELNNSVDASSGTPISGFSGFDYTHRENQNPGGSGTVVGAANSPFVTSVINPVDNLNNALPNTELLSFSVLDNLNRNRTSSFDMIVDGNGYRIKITDPFYFGINASTAESYNFTMFLRNTDDNTTANVDGDTTSSPSFTAQNVAAGKPILTGQGVYNGAAFIGSVIGINGLVVTLNTAVTLTDNLALTFKAVTRAITKTGSLSNIAPSVSSIVYTQPSYSTMQGVYTTITSVNGTFDSTRSSNDLTYSWNSEQPLLFGGYGDFNFGNYGTAHIISINNPNGGYVSLSLLQNGEIRIFSGAFDFLSTFSLKATVTDAGGASVEATITFNDVIPGAFTNAFSTAFDI